MQFIGDLLAKVMNKLPGSPFQGMIVAIEDSAVLSAINWFIPFSAAVSMLQAWAACMLLFYGYRFIKQFVSQVIGKFLS